MLDSARIIRPARTHSAALFGFLAFAVFGLAAPAAHAQAGPGKYRCISVRIDQKSEPCRSPSLTLKNDGSYEIWGENGTYEVVQDHWLVLSHSKRRGLGYIENSGEIIFEYHVGKRLCRVIFEKVSTPTPGYFQG
jgi:hypothetical protein